MWDNMSLDLEYFHILGVKTEICPRVSWFFTILFSFLKAAKFNGNLRYIPDITGILIKKPHTNAKIEVCG